MEIEEVTGEPRTEVTRVNITEGATSANPMRAKRIPDVIAVELDAPERISLFCIASGANAAGNTASVRSRLIARGLIERASSQLATIDLERSGPCSRRGREAKQIGKRWQLTQSGRRRRGLFYLA
jgi:hypothetical protein